MARWFTSDAPHAARADLRAPALVALFVLAGDDAGRARVLRGVVGFVRTYIAPSFNGAGGPSLVRAWELLLLALEEEVPTRDAVAAVRAGSIEARVEAFRLVADMGAALSVSMILAHVADALLAVDPEEAAEATLRAVVSATLGTDSSLTLLGMHLNHHLKSYPIPPPSGV